MPTDYVEDYEQVTGKKITSDVAPVIETKVVFAPVVEVASATVAEVK